MPKEKKIVQEWRRKGLRLIQCCAWSWKCLWHFGNAGSLGKWSNLPWSQCPACPSRDWSKGPTIALELLIPPLCKRSVLGCSIFWGAGCLGGLGLEAHEGDLPYDETLYPRGVPPQRKDNWKDCGCTIAIRGCSNLAVLYKEREEPDIEQEAEKYVYSCFKSKAYCLGDKMWTVLLWNDCVDECVCISTLPCFTLSHTAGGGVLTEGSAANPSGFVSISNIWGEQSFSSWRLCSQGKTHASPLWISMPQG